MHARPPPNSFDADLAISAERLALVRHELRTPLATILGYTQLVRRRLERIADGSDDQVEIQRYARAIEMCCRQLAAAIDRIDPDNPEWSAGVTDSSDGSDE
jgi:signal transduction histidine kinase